MMEKLKCASCLRFEELLDKWETEALTDDEVDFVLDHEDNCPTDLHTFEAVEEAYGLPDGSLRNWNGRDPLPRPDARALEARARALQTIAAAEDAEPSEKAKEERRGWRVRIGEVDYDSTGEPHTSDIHLIGLAASEFGRQSLEAAEGHSDIRVSMWTSKGIIEMPLAAFGRIGSTSKEVGGVERMAASEKRSERSARLSRKHRKLFRRAVVGPLTIDAFGDDDDNLSFRIVETEGRKGQ